MTCFVASASLLSSATVLPVRPLTEPTECAKDVRTRLATARNRPGVLGAVRSLVSRDVREVHAVRDISFQIQAGEGTCWQVVYSTPAFRNLADQWRDK